MEFLKSETDSEDDENLTVPEDAEKSVKTVENSLPSISKERYEHAYKQFMDWRLKNKADSFSENVLMTYFVDLSTKYKSSTLWSIYSMVRGSLVAKHNVNIATYSKLKALLKKKSVNYVAKKANVLTNDNIKTFIETAPNDKFLLTKTILIFGVCGCMRKGELYNVKLGDVKDVNVALIVNVPYTKSKKLRQFVIADNFYSICKEYMNLRPSGMTDTKQNFFINYQKGKCTRQAVGINKLGRLVQDIAKFLKLPHPETYTGHTFRRTSATIVADITDGDPLALKRHGGWQSTKTAARYIYEPISKNIKIAPKISKQIGEAISSGCGTQPPQAMCTTLSLVPVVYVEQPRAKELRFEKDPLLVEENNGSQDEEKCSIKIEEEKISEIIPSPSRPSSRNSVTDAVETTCNQMNDKETERVEPLARDLNKSNWCEEDANESFFKSMCNIVRGLPGHQQAVIRNQVAKIVLEADVNFQNVIEIKQENV